ncbi:MAG: hypothetical protein AB1Z65_18355, partial [Candidatus Sulfomarinibacteraceae bacterium]
PAEPRIVGSVDTPGIAWGVAVSGSIAFVADMEQGLRVIDVNTPSEPVEIAFIGDIGYSYDVAISGEFAYVVSNADGLAVIDVSTPASPFVVGRHDTPGWADAVAVSNGFAYIAAAHEGLRVIDVRNPAAPVEISAIETMRYARQVAVAGGFVYIADGTFGMRTIDVSDPWNPREVCVFDTAGSVTDVAPATTHLVVTDTSVGISVLREGNHVYWLENVAHLPGLLGSLWRTDVVAKNSTLGAADLEIRLHYTDGVADSNTRVASGQQRAMVDVIGSMSVEGKGCLEVRSDAQLQVSGRIYNQTDVGTFGQYIEAYESSDGLQEGQTATLLQLRQMRGEYRTNLSITNTGDEPAEVAIRLFNSGGDELIEYTLDVGPTSLLQDPQPFKLRAGQPDLGWGFAEVEVLNGSGILASASVVDSQTNDATTVPFTR